MTARAIAAAWVAALLLFAMAALALVEAAVRLPPPFPPGTEVIFIGSSLTRNAVPLGPVPGGVLGDGRPHARWSAASIGEDLTLDLLDRAIASDAPVIAIEFNALTTDTRAEAADKAQGLAGELNEALRDFNVTLHDGWANLTGHPEETVHAGEPDLAPIAWQVTPKLRRVQLPDTFRAPEQRLRLDELLARARARGKQLVFYEPPRSETMMAAMGEAKAADFAAHLHRMAQELNTPLILFGPAWPDALFRDPVHLNRDGRARFLAELPAKFRAALP